MNKIVFSLFWFLFLFCPVSGKLHAQQQKIDSLINVIENAPADLTKVMALNTLSELYENIDLSISLEYAEQGLELSKELGSDKGISICLNQIGIAYHSMGKFDSAMVHFEKRLDVVTAIDDTLGIASSVDNISMILVHKGEFDKALDLRMKSNDIYLNAGEMISLASGYVWIGNIHNLKSDYEQALQYYLKANTIFEENHEEYYMAYSVVNISSVYRQLKQYDKSIQYAQQAKEIFERMGDQNGIGVSLYRLALVYDESGEPGKSIEALEEALDILSALGNDYFVNLINGQLGRLYCEKKEFDKALETLQKCLDHANESGDKADIDFYLCGISDIYYAKKDYQTALKYCKKAELIMYKSENKNNLSRLFQGYVRLFARLNEPDSVDVYLAKYIALKDSVFNEQTVRAIAEMQEKYDSEKKEKEIALLNLEKEKRQHDLDKLTQEHRIANLELMQAAIEHEKFRQNLQLANTEREYQRTQIDILTLNEQVREQKLQQEKREKMFLIIGFVLIFLAGGVITYYILISYRNRKKKEEARLKQEAAELSRQLVETNMKAINFQLNPHFIFNCVHTVEYLLGQSKVKESMTCLRKFSDLIRMMLEGMSKKEIPLERELDILRLYMDLEKMRHTHDFSYSIETDSQIDPVTTMVPPLILQPFVENSIKHGFVQDGKEYHIRIRLQAEEGKLHCEITDNGIGFSTKKDQMSVSGFKKESLGLKLTEDRLRLINQMTRSEYSYSIGDLNNEENNTTGTLVSLQLPYILAA